MKENLTCCIGNFGLAVKCEPETEKSDIKPDTQVGTRRYMAPEVISNTLDTSNFTSYKMADMYSFGLVLWEIARRGVSEGWFDSLRLVYLNVLWLKLGECARARPQTCRWGFISNGAFRLR